MKRILVLLAFLVLASAVVPVHAAGGPRDRRHPQRDWHQPACATQAAQSAAYAWMNEMRWLNSTAPGYVQWRKARIARFRRETLRLAQAEPHWFRAKMKRATRLNDRGHIRRAIGVIWSALERPCQ